jgi:hypothetical protein
VRRSRMMLTAAAVGALALATLTSAEAGHRRVHAYPGYAVNEASCIPVAPSFINIYPAADWEPFFRHRFYRYGPIYAGCEAAVDRTNLVSVRY